MGVSYYKRKTFNAIRLDYGTTSGVTVKVDWVAISSQPYSNSLVSVVNLTNGQAVLPTASNGVVGSYNVMASVGSISNSITINVEKPNGVDQVSTDNTVEIYPNPASESVTIKSENGKCPLSVYNSMGSLVYFVPDFENQITIPTSKIGGKGVYFVKANYAVKKLIVGN